MSFDALFVATEAVRHVRKPLELIALHDGDLANQVRRAATSVPLNIAEGRERAGRDRAHHYRVARGSAAEVVAALGVAVALGYLDDAAAADALGALDRVRAMLWRLTH